MRLCPQNQDPEGGRDGHRQWEHLALTLGDGSLLCPEIMEEVAGMGGAGRILGGAQLAQKLQGRSQSGGSSHTRVSMRVSVARTNDMKAFWGLRI